MTDDAGNAMDHFEVLGTAVSPDGQYKTTVYHMRHWATGMLMVRQEGEGQTFDHVYSRDEAHALADILKGF